MCETKIKCVVIEDEEHTTKLMENYISQVDQLEWLGSFVSPVEFFNFDRMNEVQMIYLDIQMPNITGVEFLKLKPINAEVIFTTAYSEYAMEGYELNVTDYLLKPVEFSRFFKATQKAIEQIKLKTLAQSPKRADQVDFIMLKVDKKLIKVLIDEIIYVQSDWNYIYVFTKHQKLMVLRTMKGIVKDLSAYRFIRIHKSYLINLDHFKSIEGNMVQLQGNVELQVSRNHKSELMEALHQL